MSKNKKYKKASSPEEVIDEAIKRKDWFSAFSNAVAYFEHWGYWRLRHYCIKEKIYEKEKIKHITVSNLVLILHLLKLIDQNTHAKMVTTIKERNKLIHPILQGEGIGYRARKEEDGAIKILENAKKCITALKEDLIKSTSSS